MASNILRSPRITFTTIPLDILNQITLDTLYHSSCPPTLRELITIRSLLLTSHDINEKLSLRRNPHLYASIMRLMYDIDPVERRLGGRATTASALASELPQRFTVLKRVRRRLSDINQDSGDRRTSLIDLAKLFTMMTENDGKNLYQLVDILGPSGLYELCLALLLRWGQTSEGDALSSDIALVVALMWLNSENVHEDQQRRDEVLDLLQPLVLGNATDGSSMAEFEYFGLRCVLDLPSAIPFARLCTVDRYDATARMNNLSPHHACIRPPRDWSVRFDDECARHLKVLTVAPVDERLLFLPSHNTAGLLFESNWAGEWYLAQSIGPTEIFMAYRTMQCQLREYVCTEADMLVGWADSGHEDDKELARAWFADGVDFDETMSSLRILDPTTSRWLSYHQRSQLTDPSAVLDTVFIGEAKPLHGTMFDEYKFHGRLRQSDGRIALVRRPTDPAMGDLGIWVFFGQIYGRFDLVGEWMNTSTAKDTPFGHGWFRLVKDASDCAV